MPVCKSGEININYRVYGEGFPLVLTHGFTASMETWAPQIKDFSRKYRLILYDARGHGLSSAPAGAENYSLDVMVEDLRHLLIHLEISQAYIGGLSMGGAVALGYAYLYPESVKALLIFDIDGGFQPHDATLEALMAQAWKKNEKVTLAKGMADLARHRINERSVFRAVLKDEDTKEQYVRRMARMSLNGYLGVGRALPWKAEWLREAADNIGVPSLVVVGGDDELKTGARMLHQHIKGSRYIKIKGCVHGTAEWRPDVFNPAVLDFLEAVELGKPVSAAIVLD